MGKSDATFRHHLDEVTEAQFKCDVPSHTQNAELLVKVPSLEQILCRGRFRHPGSYRRIPSLSTVCTRTLINAVYSPKLLNKTDRACSSNHGGYTTVLWPHRFSAARSKNQKRPCENSRSRNTTSSATLEAFTHNTAPI